MKETWDKTMKESTSTNACARSEDLVTYLYGEATQNQALDFERHIERCASCSTELATFGDVRGAVGEWRQQVLGSLASPGLEANAVRSSAAAVAPVRGRSALAALREFFTLSPMWMRAATAVAALVFCALATIAVAYFVQRPQTVIVETPVKTGYSDKEMKAMIEEALKKQNELQAKTGPVPPSESLVVPGAEQPNALPRIKPRPSGTPQPVNSKRRQQVVPGNIPQPSKTEVLASSDYLPFTAPGYEEKLPSLSDLVDDNEN